MSYSSFRKVPIIQIAYMSIRVKCNLPSSIKDEDKTFINDF